MAQEKKVNLAFNRGVMSTLGLARIDIDRMGMSAETQTNFMPRVLGSMMLRPGMKYIGDNANDAAVRMIPFVFAEDDYALLEVTNTNTRVWIDDVVVTRPAVTSAVADGTFVSAATVAANWTDNDEAGGASAWATGGYLALLGDDTNRAIRSQQVTTVETGVEHALRIVVARGIVTLRVGSTAAADDYVSATSLGAGTHSLAFTPTGNFFIEVSSVLSYTSLLDSIVVESSGVMELPTPWTTAQLPDIRFDQSGDVIYVACYGVHQYKFERRATRSWSIVKYEPLTGPFRNQYTGLAI